MRDSAVSQGLWYCTTAEAPDERRRRITLLEDPSGVVTGRRGRVAVLRGGPSPRGKDGRSTQLSSDLGRRGGSQETRPADPCSIVSL